MTVPTDPAPESPPPVTEVVPRTPERLSLWERLRLTYRYQGRRVLVQRLLTYPLRYTPLRHRFQIAPSHRRGVEVAARWYRSNGSLVTVVIPSYKDFDTVAALVRSIRATTDRERVRIVIADDASGEDHVTRLRTLDGVEVIAGEENRGFAANVNRGLAAADPRHDVVLLNSDVVPLRGWLACLQHALTREPSIGVVGAKLLYPDNRIQYGGTIRNYGAMEWFDHRYRFKPAEWGPANVGGPTLAATGATMYITRAALENVGLFDEAYPMGYEDVDYCLRAWQAGYVTTYAPDAQLYHLESATRGTEVGERERISQRVFWERWATFFDARNVSTPKGALRVINVAEDTGSAGEQRDMLKLLDGLATRGHEVELWILGAGCQHESPCRTRMFEDWSALSDALAPLDAIKVATSFRASAAVWRGSVTHGIAVFFVHRLGTKDDPSDPLAQDAVIDAYRPEFHYLTVSPAIRDRLRELGLEATVIAPVDDTGDRASDGLLDGLETFLTDVASPRAVAYATDAVPGPGPVGRGERPDTLSQ